MRDRIKASEADESISTVIPLIRTLAHELLGKLAQLAQLAQVAPASSVGLVEEGTSGTIGGAGIVKGTISGRA